MTNFIEVIQSKVELLRLEQRYTKRRNRRTTFVSEATYVDGEYIYQTPATTTKRAQPQHTGSHMSSSSDSSTSSTNSNTFSMRSMKSRSFMGSFGRSERAQETQRPVGLSPVDHIEEGEFVGRSQRASWRNSMMVKMPSYSSRRGHKELVI